MAADRGDFMHRTAPFSASLRHIALRTPWAERPLRPACLHWRRNHCEKLRPVNACPYSLVRNTRCSLGIALMAAASSEVMQRYGISRWHPDPLRAIEAAQANAA
jgi:hypothetical protein